MNNRAIIRVHKNRIVVLCHLGHVITSIDTGPRSLFVGSRSQAEIGAHAAGQPNLYDRQSAACKGHGHE